jgi:hypothetical protein
MKIAWALPKNRRCRGCARKSGKSFAAPAFFDSLIPQSSSTLIARSGRRPGVNLTTSILLPSWVTIEEVCALTPVRSVTNDLPRCDSETPIPHYGTATRSADFA